MFKLFRKIREHYVTAARGRERNAYVVRLIAAVLMLLLAIALPLCGAFDASARIIYLVSGSLFAAGSAVDIADVVENLYYVRGGLGNRILGICCTLFPAVILFICASIS